MPTTKQGFKDFCLRKLGDGVIEINISEEQVDERLDEALRFYYDYHFDGSHKTYYKHAVTANNISDGYITLPENIIGVVKVFNIDDPSIRSSDMFNIRYQIALNDLYTLTSVSMVPYYMKMENLALISEMLVGNKPIRYNRHMDRLYVDMDWTSITVGEYLLVEAYEIVDPETYTDAYGDRWLIEYYTQLLKYQWGSNLTKFTGVQLPGGVEFNGEKILEDAKAELDKLREEMITAYSLPVSDMWG